MTNEITVTLYRSERLNNSVNGNPRFRLHTSEGAFATQSDAAVVYAVTNFADDTDVVLTLSRNGRVTHMQAANTNQMR